MLGDLLLGPSRRHDRRETEAAAGSGGISAHPPVNNRGNLSRNAGHPRRSRRDLEARRSRAALPDAKTHTGL
jgi:hypothetical protein